jgi:DNA-binding PucR family transcriptional regulator
MDLDAAEVRVLGCLIEKQRTTPDVYPLSLNALRLACNQSTNRDPVVEYDERHQSDLVPTLRAFLDCNGSWTACSTRLHLHVNSVRYRIQRIEELTGRDLSGLEDRVNFSLALRMS